MAADGCIPTKFVNMSENSFYFEDAETDWDEDTYQLSNKHCKHLIRSKDNKCLLLNDDSKFQAENLTKSQQTHPECQFNIRRYNNSNMDQSNKRAVMLYAVIDGKKMVACCSEKHEIDPEAMELPDKIEETAHKALFYLIPLTGQTNKFMFESSLYPSKFLGFEPIESNPSLNKLVLRHKVDQVDESCEVSLSDCNASQHTICL
ncbi:interleukin-18-like [Micropterus salmoides]|uniref:interleukin-18-like n=1 Tax=Micropterus salmoides TaxID=27706 RepID=UPI0018EC17B2|nr:interleukin-18-like [Micropterus salmoides]XP_038548672.1 interleukin-18-like [Micropterus salmoides]